MASQQNLHAVGPTPTRGEANILGFDVRFQETHDRHRRYQAVVSATGALVGAALDLNYEGFDQQDQALRWLKAQTAFTTAVTTAGGVTESGDGESLVGVGSPSTIKFIDARFTPGENLERP